MRKQIRLHIYSTRFTKSVIVDQMTVDNFVSKSKFKNRSIGMKCCASNCMTYYVEINIEAAPELHMVKHTYP